MHRTLGFLILAIAMLSSTACSHYRMGTGSERPYDSIFIQAVETQGVIPQSAAIFTTQLRDTFIKDARLRVVNTPQEADAILSVKLGSLRRERLTSLPNDTGLTRKFGLQLNASCTLIQAKDGKAYFTDRPLIVERQIFSESGTGLSAATIVSTQQVQAEYQIVPQLATPLAEQARSAVLDTW